MCKTCNFPCLLCAKHAKFAVFAWWWCEWCRILMICCIFLFWHGSVFLILFTTIFLKQRKAFITKTLLLLQNIWIVYSSLVYRSIMGLFSSELIYEHFTHCGKIIICGLESCWQITAAARFGFQGVLRFGQMFIRFWLHFGAGHSF